MGTLGNLITVTKAICLGELRFTRVDGKLALVRGRCHKCGARISVTPGEKGDLAAECGLCGEKLFWSADFPAARPPALPPYTGPLPPEAVKEIKNLITDARLAFMVGLLPFLGELYIGRLIQWYGLRRRFAILTAADGGADAKLARQFRGAWWRLWFAVLLFPIVLLVWFCFSKVVK